MRWVVGLVSWFKGGKVCLGTYDGGFASRCLVRRRDVIGIAHGEESIDRTVMVSAHRVDDIVPITKERHVYRHA